jgi:hypothetical protein
MNISIPLTTDSYNSNPVDSLELRASVHRPEIYLRISGADREVSVDALELANALCALFASMPVKAAVE